MSLDCDNTSESGSNPYNEDLPLLLRQFTGTCHYYKHPSGLHYTDGVQWLANHANCYWLLDAIASWQPASFHLVGAEFQLWTLTVSQDHSAMLECRSDSDQPAKILQRIEYTDFPLNHFTLYCESGVLLLPSEH